MDDTALDPTSKGGGGIQNMENYKISKKKS